MPQQIFVLTDGAVMDIREVVQLARDHKNIAEVHTFGIGSGASPGLVIELAKASGGSYAFALEGENIKAKVVNALARASRPNLIKAKWQISGANILAMSPRANDCQILRTNQLYTFFALLDTPVDANTFKLGFSFVDPLNDFEHEEVLRLNDLRSRIPTDGASDELFKLAAFYCSKQML